MPPLSSGLALRLFSQEHSKGVKRPPALFPSLASFLLSLLPSFCFLLWAVLRHFNKRGKLSTNRKPTQATGATTEGTRLQSFELAIVCLLAVKGELCPGSFLPPPQLDI